jgi:Nucleotidyl transferase AbiEii toxin, Type IV TA system
VAVTAFQRRLCKLLAATRIASGESYVAGGVALNELLATPRRSRDIDLFHDTDAALQSSWEADRALLNANGYDVTVLRERATFVEARVSSGHDRVLVEWARDSAFRFFPLLEHADLGLVLHPFDLATNKVLALVGRLEPRDWIDVLECDARLQPLGYLAWAACGKDPGFGPKGILEEAARGARYSETEIATLDFEGEPPDAGELGRRWHTMLATAGDIVDALPAAEAGRCVLDDQGNLVRHAPSSLRGALAQGSLRFHAGSIRGALPCVLPAS